MLTVSYRSVLLRDNMRKHIGSESSITAVIDILRKHVIHVNFGLKLLCGGIGVLHIVLVDSILGLALLASVDRRVLQHIVLHVV